MSRTGDSPAGYPDRALQLYYIPRIHYSLSLDVLDSIPADNSYLDDENPEKIPLPLIEICEQAMKREISDRFFSSQELAQAVLDWLEGAQKRDKALKEISNAEEFMSKAKQLEKNSDQQWIEANHLIEQYGVDNSAGWERWEEAYHAKQEAILLRRTYRQTLQGALVYDPELEEANSMLAKLLIVDIIEVIAKGERQQRELLQKEFECHLPYVSTKIREELVDQLKEWTRPLVCMEVSEWLEPRRSSR